VNVCYKIALISNIAQRYKITYNVKRTMIQRVSQNL